LARVANKGDEQVEEARKAHVRRMEIVIIIMRRTLGVVSLMMMFLKFHPQIIGW
jgi:hypothetical protein